MHGSAHGNCTSDTMYGGGLVASRENFSRGPQKSFNLSPRALGHLGCYLFPLTPGSVPYKRLAARGSGVRGLGSPKAATLGAGACAGLAEPRPRCFDNPRLNVGFPAFRAFSTYLSPQNPKK